MRLVGSIALGRPARSPAWVALAWVALALAAPVARAQVQETTELVAMRDGTRLATTIWRPTGADLPRPVLLRRTPYGREIADDVAQGVVTLGYTLVSQDVRGRGESEGSFSPFRDDAHDGADAIAWIASQPWSNARVGSYGGSAEGIVQLMAAGEAPPALRCAMPMVATADVHEGLYPGGAWRDELGTSWLSGLGEPEALVDFRAHEARDAYWDPAILDDDEIARIAIPIFLVGGFFDIFSIGTPRTFARLRASSGAPGDQFLLFGPWTHGGLSSTTQGDLTFPPSSGYEAYVTELFAFFDWCLRDGPRPTWAPVRYWVTRLDGLGHGAMGEWRDASAWPPPSTPRTLHVHADRALRDEVQAASVEAIALPSDPSGPIPSNGGGNLSTPAGPMLQSRVDERDDVFWAMTPPATGDVEIVGDVRATIWASSDTTDVDVIVRLSEIVADGSALLLTDGIRRGRFARSPAAAEPMTPGEPIPFEVELGPVGIELPAGHALRVSIQATSSPRYEPSPGTADPIATATPRATTLHVHLDADHPSTITLPIVTGGEHLVPAAADVDGGRGLDAGPSSPTASGCGCTVGPRRRAPLALALALGLALVAAGRGRTRRSRAHPRAAAPGGGRGPRPRTPAGPVRPPC